MKRIKYIPEWRWHYGESWKSQDKSWENQHSYTKYSKTEMERQLHYWILNNKATGTPILVRCREEVIED